MEKKLDCVACEYINRRRPSKGTTPKMPWHAVATHHTLKWIQPFNAPLGSGEKNGLEGWMTNKKKKLTKKKILLWEKVYPGCSDRSPCGTD